MVRAGTRRPWGAVAASRPPMSSRRWHRMIDDVELEPPAEW